MMQLDILRDFEFEQLTAAPAKPRENLQAGSKL